MPKPPEIQATVDSPRAKVARELLSLYLAEVHRYVPALLRQRTVDDVHDLRVSVRRLRAAIRVFDDDAKTLRAYEAGLKVLQDALGGVRDLDVEREWYLNDAVFVEGVSSAGLDALLKKVEAPLPQRERVLARALRGFLRETSASLQFNVRIHAPEGLLGGMHVRKVLSKCIRRAEKSLEKLDARMKPEDVHELRIDAKKLRYTAEPLLSAFPKLEALLDALASLQKQLGNLHDVDVRREKLQALSHSGTGAARGTAVILEAAAAEERELLAQKALAELQLWKQERRFQLLADQAL